MDEVELNLAKDYYLKGDYLLASQAYADLVEKNPDNPYLLISAGSSYFQENQYGKALNSYYKAKKILPRNKVLNNNIQLVKEKVIAAQPILASYNLFTLNEALILLLIVNLLFILKRYISKNKAWLRLASLSFIITIYITAYTYIEQAQTQYATITKISCNAYSGDNEEFTQLYELVDGQIVKIIRSEENWLQIKHNNELGWIKKDTVELI